MMGLLVRKQAMQADCEYLEDAVMLGLRQVHALLFILILGQGTANAIPTQGPDHDSTYLPAWQPA
jgi:hypothetical protein